jgi:lambda-carrageenase
MDAVFMQIIRIEKDHYRLVFVDPGWMNPAEHNVEVKIQMDGNFEAENILDKQVYPILNNQFKVSVSAGLFSVIDVKKK